MNTVNTAASLNSGYGLQRRPSPARSPGAESAAAAGETADASNFATESGADQVVRGALGRVANRQWQENVNLAYGVRGADQAMAEIGNRLEEAKEDLTKIVKMFPPYPRDSRERTELLNSYRSLRAQVDQLTFPPENELAAQIMEGDGAGKLPADLRGFAVGSGEAGLALPELPAEPEALADAELEPLLADLERSGKILAEKRQGLREAASDSPGEEAEVDALGRRVGAELVEAGLPMARSQTGIHAELPRVDWGKG
ncbi:MAG: hypothetical protein JXR89_07875 [Deltaproteobacteria bacterium]|nr:hypothetical protein [Deltaproteobacteria bacterium]